MDKLLIPKDSGPVLHLGVTASRANLLELLGKRHDPRVQSGDRVWDWHVRRLDLRRWRVVPGISRLYVAVKKGLESWWIGYFIVIGEPVKGVPVIDEDGDSIGDDGRMDQPVMMIPVDVRGFVWFRPRLPVGFWLQGPTYRVPEQEVANV